MSDYKSWQQREAEAELTAAQAAQARVAAEAAKVDLAGNAAGTKTRQMREQLAQLKLQQQMAEAAQASADKAADRKRQIAEQRADAGLAFKRMSLAAVIVLLAVALPAQISYFLGLHKAGQHSTGPAWLMGPAPFGLEMLAWVGVAGTSWARRKGLPLWPFWLMTGALASFAASVNLAHGTADYGPVAGWTLAGFSLLAPMLWELREWMDSRAAVDGRDRQQRAADKARVAKEKAAAKAKAEHDAKRAKADPAVWARCQQIMTAYPLGAVEEEAAWRQAWDDVHRAPLGVTAQTYRARVEADAALDEVLALGRDRSVYRELDAFLFDLFPDDGDGGTGAVQAAPDKPSGGPVEALKFLGRKGERPSAGGAQKTPQRPLDPEHIERVEKLAEALGGKDKLSLRNVREAIGGGSNEYAVRLRDAVKNAGGDAR